MCFMHTFVPVVVPLTSNLIKIMTNWTRVQTGKLVEVFQQYPQLYDVQHVDYQNRKKREDNIRDICEFLKDLRPETTPNDVRAKIKTLRSQYMREKRNVEMSRKSGAGTDAIYIPKLWCYDSLQFLNSSTINVPGSSNISFSSVSNSVLSDSLDALCSGEGSQTCTVSQSKKTRKITVEKTMEDSLALAGQFAAHLNEKENTPQHNLATFIEQELKDIPSHIFHDVKWNIMELVKQAQERALRENNRPTLPSSYSHVPTSTPKQLTLLKVEVLKKASVQRANTSNNNNSSSNSGILETEIEELFEDDNEDDYGFEFP